MGQYGTSTPRIHPEIGEDSNCYFLLESYVGRKSWLYQLLVEGDCRVWREVGCQEIEDVLFNIRWLVHGIEVKTERVVCSGHDYFV